MAILHFWQMFSIVPFHLLFVVASKIKLIPRLSFIAVTLNEWSKIQHADVSRPPLVLIRFWWLFVDFPGLKFGMLMFSDHLQHRLDFDHGLLIFLILTPYCFNETGQIFFSRTHGKNGLKFTCWYILTTFKTDCIWVMVGWFSSFRCHFDQVKQCKCEVSRHFLDNVWEEWAEICHVILYLISPKMIKAHFSTWKLSSYRLGVCLTTV